MSSFEVPRPDCGQPMTATMDMISNAFRCLGCDRPIQMIREQAIPLSEEDLERFCEVPDQSEKENAAEPTEAFTQTFDRKEIKAQFFIRAIRAICGQLLSPVGA